MQFSTIISLSIALLGAGISGLENETSQFDTVEAGGATYTGVLASKRALVHVQRSGWIEECGSCKPGKDQCYGKPGCYSCNGGPYVCQIPNVKEGCKCGKN